MGITELTMVCGLIWMVIITVVGVRSIVFDLVLLLTIAWTGESLIGYGLIPDNVPDVIFIYVIVLLFSRIIFSRENRTNGMRLPGLAMFLAFIVASYVSAALNDVGFLRYALFVRQIVLFYLFFIGIVNTNIQGVEIHKLNKYMMFIFLLQVVVATGKWLVMPQTAGEFGQESFTGTYATHGGEFHTLLPLMAIAFIVPAYFVKKRKIFVALFWVFIWFSVVGEKRATVFALPIFMVYLLYLMRGRFRVEVNLAKVSSIMLSVLVAVFIIVKVNHTLNREYRTGGTFDLQYVFDYAQKYTTGYSNVGNVAYAVGRYAATETMFGDLASAKLAHVLFGRGAGIGLRTGLVENRFQETFLMMGIQDGITGFIWMVAQIGLVGVLLLLAFFFRLFQLVYQMFKTSTNDYWKIFFVGTLGNLGVFAFDFFAYSQSFVTNETLLVTLFYFLSMCFHHEQTQGAEPAAVDPVAGVQSCQRPSLIEA